MTPRRWTLPARLATVLLGLALAACQQPVNDTDIAIDNGAGASVPSDAIIPAQYRGRWGMNANDCDPRRSDNKGLITVAEKTIRFYESTATLKEQRPSTATGFAGSYGFTGEGQTWDKIVTLTRTGSVLKRADDEGSFTYNRCS